MLGNISFSKRLPSAGVSPPSLQGCKAVWMWHLGTWDGGGLGSAGEQLIHDPVCLLHPQ